MTGTTATGRTLTTRVPWRWTALYGLAWTGVWMAQLAPFQYLLPTQLTEALGTSPNTDWQTSVYRFGIVSALSASCLAVGLPLFGALSDRTVSRFGRRRPWIGGGAVVFALALAALGVQKTTLGVAVWWCIAMLGFCPMAAALTALIKDRVPHDQRGTVAGVMSMAQAAGLIIGLGSLAVLTLPTGAGYVLIAVLLCAFAAPFVLTPNADHAIDGRRTPPLDDGPSPLQLLRVHDFRWALVGRVTVNVGNTLTTCLLIYFLQFELRITNPKPALLILTVTYILSVLSVSVVCGWLSDRVGRRKPFIIGSAALQSVAAVILIASESLPSTVLALAMIGAGYGCYLTVDQALGADVLPDAEHSGKELGLMNTALLVPPAVCPLLGAGLVGLFGGAFASLFATAAVLTLLGGLTVLRIRSVD